MENHLKAATVLAYALDSQFSFFGKRFGLNGIIGLIPFIGDGIVAFLSFYLVWVGIQMHLPLAKIIEMIGNIVINFFIGLVPIIGDFADFFHKANLANLKILKDNAKEHSGGRVMQPQSYAAM